MVQIGAWGYLAFTTLGCFGLHYCPGKVGEHFTKLMAPVDDWLDAGRAAGEVAFDDEHVLDDEADEYFDDVVEDQQARPLFPPLTPPREKEAPLQPLPANGRPGGGEPVVMTPTEASSSLARSNGAPGRSAGRRPPAAAAKQLPVIGGASDETTTLAAALREPARYFVDPETGRIWCRAYWDELHGDRLHGRPKDDGLRQEER